MKPLKKIWRFAPRFPPWPLKGPLLPPWPRGTHLHEESRKVLSVLLAYVDGLDSVPLPSHASPQRWTLGGGVALRCAGVERPPFCSAGTSSEATVLLVGATNRQQDCDPARLLFHEMPPPPLWMLWAGWHFKGFPGVPGFPHGAGALVWAERFGIQSQSQGSGLLCFYAGARHLRHRFEEKPGPGAAEPFRDRHHLRAAVPARPAGHLPILRPPSAGWPVAAAGRGGLCSGLVTFLAEFNDMDVL